MIGPQGKTIKFVLKSFAVLVLIGIGWVGFDLYGPHHSKMRDFDGTTVGILETDMWRSYYEHRQVKLFNEVTSALRTQFKLPLVRSNALAYELGRATFTFKDGHNRTDYEKALPGLTSFYTSIHQISDIDFDPRRAARLELDWWIIHRERGHHKPEDLVNALAALQAEIYQIPVDRVMEHARLRAEAMTIRDSKSESSGVSPSDWKQIEDLLRASWESLHKAVNTAQG